ncbi:hypothetical protein [Pseudomonas coronafaciens]|uniref:hypothetical protein n=1 Tax=Pseudomonas coronafaciens TaxID=53409 RepID=UPI0006D5DD3D|nr:hypothetical protein [Pseudomonas coronafaciens]KPZ29117.1 Uncharacterized protein ALO38_03207 [Pseudomonas coronafaciens pv. zizaniae]
MPLTPIEQSNPDAVADVRLLIEFLDNATSRADLDRRHAVAETKVAALKMQGQLGTLMADDLLVDLDNARENILKGCGPDCE